MVAVIGETFHERDFLNTLLKQLIPQGFFFCIRQVYLRLIPSGGVTAPLQE
jgi:hypothetical protein